MSVRVNFMNGPEDGDGIVLDQGSYTVGRDENNDISLYYDSSISRHHARIEYDGARMSVTDLDSRNGTFVNGVAVEGPASLRTGDFVKMGHILLQVIRPE